MIDNVETNGPYIVVAPACLSRTPGRRRPCTHRHVLGAPGGTGCVRPQTNDPVDLLVALVATDAWPHMRPRWPNLAKVSSAARRSGPPEHRRHPGGGARHPGGTQAAQRAVSTGRTKQPDLTVCGNGLGTSLFLKNTLEQVLGTWGWARLHHRRGHRHDLGQGPAKDADLILTSGEIAKTLGDVGSRCGSSTTSTSTREIDAACATPTTYRTSHELVGRRRRVRGQRNPPRSRPISSASSPRSASSRCARAPAR